MPKTILLTGGVGYIGSHAAWLLMRQNYRVITLDLKTNAYKNISTIHVQGDCADIPLLKKLFITYDIEAVMHFAAHIESAASIEYPLAYYHNNVTKTLALLQTMIEHKILKFIFSSSCCVYGIPRYLPLNEQHTKNPINPYGKTKSMIEDILHDLDNAYNLRFVALRYFNAAGALPEEQLGEDHQPETHLIPILLQAAVRKKPFTLYGTHYETKDGTAVRDFVHVLDIAHGHMKALEHLLNRHPSDYFNLGTGCGYSIKEIIASVEQVCQTPIHIEAKDPRAGDVPILIADSNKASSILQWKPRYSNLDLIIRSAYGYELQKKQNSFLTAASSQYKHVPKSTQ